MALFYTFPSIANKLSANFIRSKYEALVNSLIFGQLSSDTNELKRENEKYGNETGLDEV